MIAKPFTTPPPPTARGHAAWQARQEMAFALDLAFVQHQDVFLFHGLRIEHDGRRHSIDHVVLHRYGLTLIESGSVTGGLTLSASGQFTRTHPIAGPKPIASPIDRVRRQARSLFGLLNAHRREVRRTKHLGDEHFTVLVAMADRSHIHYQDAPPPELIRAERVNSAVHAHVQHTPGTSSFASFIRFMRTARTSTLGLRQLKSAELSVLHGFMLAYHKPAPSTRNFSMPPSSPDRTPSLYAITHKSLSAVARRENTVKSKPAPDPQ